MWFRGSSEREEGARRKGLLSRSGFRSWVNQAGFSSAQLQVASDGGVNGGHTGTSGAVKGGRIAGVSIVGIVVVVKVVCRRRGEEEKR